MIKLLGQIPAYRSFYRRGRPLLLPMNLTFSLTSRCNSKCLTCNIWRDAKPGELTLAEYTKIFQSLGQAPQWLTLSGGEPFLRNDLAELVPLAVVLMRPEVINIPTNGLLTEKIVTTVEKICASTPQLQLVINVSVDDIGPKDDLIRGIDGAYEKARATFSGLKKLRRPNLTVGVHTVVSRFNVEHIEAVIDHLLGWQPDSYVTEVAEKRVELRTQQSDISPTDEEYIAVLKLLRQKIKPGQFQGLSRLTQAIRREYYALLIKELTGQNPVIPCYAAFSSAQVSASGEVWNCCVLALGMGNLRDHDFDFPAVWFSPLAQEIRQNLKRSRCFCPLANAHYTSMLFDYPTLLRIGYRYLTGL